MSIKDLYGSYNIPAYEVGGPIMSRGSDLPTSTEYHILNIIFKLLNKNLHLIMNLPMLIRNLTSSIKQSDYCKVKIDV